MNFKKAKAAVFNLSSLAFVLGLVTFVAQGRGSRQNYGYIDPNIYSGLAFEYQSLVSELGMNYYATRIWHVLPLSLISVLFGSFGPVAYLMLIAGFSTLIAFKFINQLLPDQNMILKFGFSLLAISVPSYLYDSNWTDEGISYIFAIFLSLYLASKFTQSRWYAIFFGFLAAVTVNIHLKSAVLVAAIFLSTFVVAAINRRGIFHLVKYVFLGAFLGSLVTEVLFQTMNPRGLWPLSWYYQVSLFLKLNKGTNGEWVSLWQLYRQGEFPYFILAPLLASVYLSINVRKILRKNSESVPIQLQVLYVFSILGTLVLFLYQEVLKFPVVTTFWYYGTFNVVLFALLATITWIYYNDLSFKPRLSTTLFWLLPIITVLPVWIVLPGSSLNIGKVLHSHLINGAISLFALAFVVIIIFEAKWRKTLQISVILSFCFLSISQFGNRTAPFRWRDIGDFQVETKLFSDEKWLLNIWSDIEGKNFKNDVAIWYENDPNGLLGSVQSSVIFADTRLTLNNTLTDTSFEEWANLHGRPKAVIYMFIYHRGDNIEGSKESIDYFADKGCKARVTTIGRPPYRDIEESPSGQIALFNLFCE